MRAWSWLRTRVRSATTERRAITSARIAVRIPRPLGVETLSLVSTRLAAAIASMRSDLPAPVASSPSLDLEHSVSDVLEVLAEAGAPAAGPLDHEHELSRGGQCLSPVLQLAVSSGAGHEDKLGEYLPKVVERDRVVARFVAPTRSCLRRSWATRTTPTLAMVSGLPLQGDDPDGDGQPNW